ncbi:MAG TPA: hypothetical protein VN881_02725 [Candidatus Acidoferrales bacterium]|nr:hypothetical protein [Candidatus Acidoferrales bacterium]
MSRALVFVAYETKMSPYTPRCDATGTSDADTKSIQPPSCEYRWHLLCPL